MKKKIVLALAFCLFLGTSKVNAQPINTAFNDDNFYACVVDAFNSKTGSSAVYTDNLSDAAMALITKLNCSGTSEKVITDVAGIEKLTGLTSLNLSDNEIKTIDLSNNTALETVNLSNNKLTEIDLSSNNSVTSLTLAGNPLLKDVELAVGQEFVYSDYIKVPTGFSATYIRQASADVVLKETYGHLVAKQVGAEILTLVIENTSTGTNEEFESTITVVDPKGSDEETTNTNETTGTDETTNTEEKTTSDTTKNPKTGVYGGSIVLIVAASGAYLFMKNKNKYSSLR